MARVILSVCFISMLAFSAQAMPSRAQLSQKTMNAERFIREEYHSEVLGFREMAKSRKAEILGFREMAESRKAEIRASVQDESLKNLKPRTMRMLVDAGEVDVCNEMFLGSLVYSVPRYHH